MERQESENRVLHELALLYIALAHGTDERLSDEEIDVIGQRLGDWEEVTAQTATSALKQAMDDYVADSGEERLKHAAATIRSALSVAQRRKLLDDLMEIALADGRFLFKESSYIEAATRLLDVQGSEREANGSTAWSLLTSDEESDASWSPLHDLALIYVTLAHRPDNDLATEEIEAIARKLNEWVPDASEDDILMIVRDALSVYAQGRDARLFAESVESVRNRIPAHQRSALLADLRFIAEADGEVLAQEREIIEKLEQAWA